MRSCRRTQCQPFYGHSAFEANWKGLKSLISECLVNWLEIQKNHCCEVSSSFILCNNCKPFLDRIVTCDKSGLYMTAGDDQLSVWTEKKPQSTSPRQTCTKKGHGHCLGVCFLSDLLQLCESQRSHYIWEVCPADQWDTPKTATSPATVCQ